MFSFLTFGTVARVSVPVEETASRIAFFDGFLRLGERLDFLNFGPVLRQTIHAVVVVAIAGHACQPKRRLPFLLPSMVFTLGHGLVSGALFNLPRLFCLLSHAGLQRRGHRLFGNVVSIW